VQLRAKQGGLVPTKLALAEQYKKEVPSMAGFTDAVANARARTGKLGAKWPDTAKVIYTGMFAWSDFIFALTLTTERNITPVTLGIYTYLGAHISNWSAVMATAMLASIPAIILLVIAQKYIAAGATGGAVK